MDARGAPGLVRRTRRGGADLSGTATIQVTAGKKKTHVDQVVGVSASGTLSLTLPKLAKGTYSVRVTYAGRPSVDKSSKTVRLTVKG